MRFATRPRCLLEAVVADQSHERPPRSGVVAEQVADRAAVRVRARQRGQVAPGDEAAGLRAEPGEHAGVGQPAHRVDRRRTARSRTAAGSKRRRRTGFPAPRRSTSPISSSLTPRAAVMASVVKTPDSDSRRTAASLCRRRSAPRWCREASAETPSNCRYTSTRSRWRRSRSSSRVVVRDQQSVGVDQDSHDRAGDELVEQVRQAGDAASARRPRASARRGGRSRGAGVGRRWRGRRRPGRRRAGRATSR